ncbi:MAG: hypothetical protein Q7S48_01925 [bacterium]|nr:hypothetical protein [bacterium]
MKTRTLLVNLLLLFITVLSPVSVQADVVSTNGIFYPSDDIYPSSGSSKISGAQHFYSILLRGNGEAIVGAKMIFENDTQAPLTEYQFQIKDASFRDVPVAFQELRRCKVQRYSQCKADESPDYIGSAYNYDISFARARVTATGNTYSVSLVEPVLPNSQAAIMLRFRSFDYTNSVHFGRRGFTFETFDVGHELKQAQVSVAVDTDLYIKGGEARVSYQQTRESLALGVEFGSSAGLSAESSPALKQFSDMITRGGQMTKTAKELASHETFKVKGTYATSKAGLYWSQITITVLIIIAFIFGLILLSRRAIRRRAGSDASEAMGKPKGSILTPFAGSILMGFGNAIVILVASYFIPMLFNRVERMMSELLLLPMLFVAFILSVALLAGPSLYYGHRYGKRYGFYTFGFLTAWLLVVIIALALFLGNTAQRYPSYYY